jgi:hypothetical protein
MLWQCVKGTLEVALFSETDYVGTKAEVEEEISAVEIVLCEGFGIEGICAGACGLMGERAWYLCRKKTRTFGQLRFSLGGVSRVDISVGLLCFGLGLADGLEELCVQTLGASSFDGAEDAGAQLGAVVLFYTGAQSLCHCDGGCGGVRVGGCKRWWARW